MEESERPWSEIAMELGIGGNQMYKWKEQVTNKGETACASRARPKKAEQSQASRLQAENKRLREGNEILKKAAVFFAKELD